MIRVENKTIKQPFVAINGSLKSVISEKVMVNGEWRTVFSKQQGETYTINLYSYGSLVRTLTCTAGESITLESVSTVYDDDVEHYGWTMTEGTTTIDFEPTEKITPTGNMNLYAVYSYEVRTVVTATLMPQVNASAPIATATVAADGYAVITGNVTVAVRGPGGSNTNSNPLSLSGTTSGAYVKIGNKVVAHEFDAVNEEYSVAVTEGTVIEARAEYTTTTSGQTTITTSRNIRVKYPQSVTTEIKYRS